jgi:hypothetical protein
MRNWFTTDVRSRVDVHSSSRNAPTRTRESRGHAVVAHRSIYRFPRVLACTLVFVTLAGLFGQANGAICKYVSRDGSITYSNVGAGPRGTSKVECFDAPAPVSAAPTTRGTDDSARTMSDTQARIAFERQLADEEQRLEEAERALSEQEANLNADGAPSYYDGLNPYLDAIVIHRRSRDRIRRQLAEHERDRTPSHAAQGRSASPAPSEGPGGTASMHEGSGIGGNPGAHPATGFGQHGGSGTGSRSESGMGRR